MKVDDVYPLSPMQEGMLFDSVSGKSPGTNVEQIVCSFPRALATETLRKAWETLVARHPILRTRFRWRDAERPMQEVLAHVAVPFDVETLKTGTTDEHNRHVDAYVKADRARGVDLSAAPNQRVRLFLFGDGRTDMVWTFHHALLDGRAIIRTLQELMSVYEALEAGRVPELHEPPSYRSYIEHLEKGDDTEGREYWKRELLGISRVTPLPYATGELAAGPGHEEVEQVVPRATVEQLRRVAKERDVTLNTVVQAAWAVVLGRHAGEDTVMFGATRACRHSVPGAGEILGLLINTLPVRADVSRGRTLDALLFDLRARWLAMRPFEEIALTTVREVSELRREGSLFESVLVFENYDLESALGASGGLWANAHVRQLEESSTPLTLAAYVRGELLLKLEYAVDQYDRATIQRLAKQLAHVLTQFAVNPEANLSEIDLLTPSERDEIVSAWNDTARSFPSYATLHHLIETRIHEAPDNVAVVDGESSITYRELDERSNRLAAHLGEAGVIRGAFVALFLPRGIAHVVSMLGVMKAGAAFVPIDPEYPRERISHLLHDSGAFAVLTTDELQSSLPAYDGIVLALDRDEAKINAQSAEESTTFVAPEDPAYVIYTSGSTGKPKGVVVSHTSIVNHVTAFAATYEIADTDRVLQFASTSFDVALEEIFPTLYAGATLVIRPRELMSARTFSEYVASTRLTVLNIPTAYFHEWVLGMSEDDVKPPDSLRLVVFGGERVTPAALNAWHAANRGRIRTMNGYGPTEATVTCTVYESTGTTSREVPIGKPIANMQAYVLDAALMPVPVGVSGDLYIGGVGLAIGYLGQYELTREKFIKHPFVDGQRLYRTGDRARFLPDANLEFQGRVDHQIKFRGYRMEPAEIQTALEEHARIDESLVLLRDVGQSDKRLVAYLVSSGEAPTVSELRTHLAARVPAYMIPTDFVFVEAFPRTTNQKIDVAALPMPGASSKGSSPANSDDTPRTPVEELLQKIWQDVLERPRVGIHDNFFDLGGHSLLTLKIIDRAARAGLRITPEQVFQRQTVAELAEVVGLHTGSDDTLITLRATGSLPPIYFVHSTPGDLFGYMSLVHALGAEQPCYGFQSLGLMRKGQAHTTIEEMADHYVARLREFQPKGPYLLAGWCYGGIVAFEMARRLRAMGEEPKMLALIEAAAPRPKISEPGYYLDRLKKLVQAGPTGIGEVALARLEFRMKFGRPQARDWLGFEVTEGVLKNRAHVFEVNMQAIYKYKPTKYAGAVQVFRCNERMKRSIPDPNLGWTALAAKVESHVSSGTHETMLAGSNADDLAHHLRALQKRVLGQ